MQKLNQLLARRRFGFYVVFRKVQVIIVNFLVVQELSLAPFYNLKKFYILHTDENIILNIGPSFLEVDGRLFFSNHYMCNVFF